MRTYLGAVSQETNRAILIRVRNAGELARSQGAMATAAQSLAPAMVEAKVYATMADQLKDALAAQNVDADVQVVEPGKWQPAGSDHVWTDVAFGIGVVGVAALVWRIFAGGKK